MVNFMLRDCWLVHCVSDDARTPVSPILPVSDQPTLIRLLRYVGCNRCGMDEVHDRIRQWSRGSVFISLTPGRKNLLRIRAPWSDGLQSQLRCQFRVAELSRAALGLRRGDRLRSQD